jgi:hypothetical protein
MKISGFSYACNADSLYYPVRESILSVLPICDEFIIAIGRGKPGDRTRDLVASINDPRITIIDTEWTIGEGQPAEHVFRQQANLALSKCSGDWCIHLQCDEVLHEKDLDHIKQRCAELVDDREVEGMLLYWKHFWGDYDHYLVSHRWFQKEVRIIRNGAGIESYEDSQSFRRNGEKIRVVQLDAELFHYSYVRPPNIMRKKQVEAHAIYRGRKAADAIAEAGLPYDYGSLEKLPRFTGTHPAVMKEWIAKMNWRDQLQYSGKSRELHTHDKFKYRFVTFIEQTFLGGRQIGGYRNYIEIRRS